MGPLLALLRRAQVVDVPNERSSHRDVVPRGGGIGVLVGWAVAVATVALATSELADVTAWSVVVACAGVVAFALLGLVDDLKHLPAALRLALQAAISAGVAAAVAVGTYSTWPALLVAVVGCVWLVSYVNAFNFMDGVNAISASSAALAGCWYGVVSSGDGDDFVRVASWALVGASLAFLPWNAPRAKVFLGDVGSYGVGALVGVLALVTALAEGSLLVALAPLTIYLADTSGTLVRRALRGESLMQAHRSHVYQRLLDVGLFHLGSTAVVVLGGIVVCAATLALPAPAAVAVAAVVVAGYLSLPALLERHLEVAR
ncbi:hypothetical protein ACS3YM_16325 [Nocardia sp. N13]|uniref:hypothetical protein n=1 Tax=Nocardioides sp. N13(2025) TaxID=3453405 RepID=UPI003F771810